MFKRGAGMKKICLEQSMTSVKRMGRMMFRENICYLIYSAAQIGFWFDGEELGAELVTDDFCQNPAERGVIGVFVGEDKEPWIRFALEKKEDTYELFSRVKYAKAKGISENDLPKEVAIRIAKFSEASCGAVGIRYLLTADKEEIRPLLPKKRFLEFIGDSITCGYGVEGVLGKDAFHTMQENPFCSYACLCADALEADYELVSWSGIGLISDYCPPEMDTPREDILALENYPYTAMNFCERNGWEKEMWDFSGREPDVVVINLGTNDDSYTRGIPERMQRFAESYEKLLSFVREKRPKAQIVCCLGVMSRGLLTTLDSLIAKRKEKDDRLHFVELLEQREEDGIGCDYHPSVRTQAIVAKTLTEAIRGILRD